jgi:hypothetical protein
MIDDTFSDKPRFYKGNLLFNFRFLSNSGLIIFTAIIALTHIDVFFKSTKGIAIISFVIIFFVFITIFQLYYFVIFEGKLLVKNQILNYTAKTYSLEKVTQIELVKSPQGYSIPDSLRITYNSKKELYRAASLSKKDWEVLLDDLRKQNIKVSETFFGNYR